MTTDPLREAEPFKPWEGDHTDLVHVLWACKNDGLTLRDDYDAVATRIMRSRWFRAALAATAPTDEAGDIIRDAEGCLWWRWWDNSGWGHLLHFPGRRGDCDTDDAAPVEPVTLLLRDARPALLGDPRIRINPHDGDAMTDFSISLSAYDRLLDLATELKAERDAAREQVARVEALHQPHGPCATVLALAAQQPQERTQEPAGRDGSPGMPIRSGGAPRCAARERFADGPHACDQPSGHDGPHRDGHILDESWSWPMTNVQSGGAQNDAREGTA